MVMDTFGDVFDEATRDYEGEQHQARLTSAGVDAQSVWPFLALAKSEEEFSHRLALAGESISTIAQRHGVSYEDVAAPLVRGFEALHPRQANGAVCANCGHSNAAHDRGSACPDCGCSSFEPKTAARTAKKEYCEQCGGDLGNQPTTSCPGCGDAYPIHLSCLADAKAEHARTGHGKTSSLQRQAAQFSKGDRVVLTSDDHDPDTGTTHKKGTEHTVSEHTSKGDADGNSWIYTHGGAVLDPAKCRKTSSLQTQATDPGSKGGPSGHKDHHSPGFTGHDSGDQDNANDDFGTPSSATTEYGPNPYDGPSYGGGAGPGNLDASYHGGQALAHLHKALMEGQDPLEWIQAQNPPGGPQNALVPSHHDTTQSFEGQPGTAYGEAMANAGGSNAPENSGGHSNTQSLGRRHPFA